MNSVDTAATIAAAEEAEAQALALYWSINREDNPRAKGAAVTLVTYAQRAREAAEDAAEAARVLEAML